MLRRFTALIALWLMFGVPPGCAGSSEGTAGDGPDVDARATSAPRDVAADLFARASALAKSGDLAGAFDALSGSMQAGHPAPSRVLSSDDLRPLLDDPKWRPRAYELLRQNAREHSITMVRPEQAGEPMILTVRIVGGHREPPEAVHPEGVIVGLVQVDAAGYYQPWTKNESWNPRHFGFAATDETGTVVFRTIRPGYYAPEYEAPDEPAHAHYNIEFNGALLRASEFFFADDPRLSGDVRQEAEAQRVPIASIARDAKGIWRAEVTIPVRGLR